MSLSRILHGLALVDISFTCIEGQQDAQQHGNHKRPLATPRQTLTPGKLRGMRIDGH